MLDDLSNCFLTVNHSTMLGNWHKGESSGIHPSRGIVGANPRCTFNFCGPHIQPVNIVAVFPEFKRTLGYVSACGFFLNYHRFSIHILFRLIVFPLTFCERRSQSPRMGTECGNQRSK